VLINKDLLKVPEIRPYSLPVDFGETREAQANNIEMRKEALRLLKEGTTIVIFPAGGVCTSPTPWGRAVDLPWKTFTARLISSARAQVLPVYFEGQCGPLFQTVSWISLTLRLSLIIAEFRRYIGRSLKVHIGDLVTSAELAQQKDRIALMDALHDRVWSLSGLPLDEVRARTERLPAYLKGSNARAKD
jgi:putative hemolysin